MSKIILEGHIIVPDADLETVKTALVTHIELTRQEAGCLVFEVAQDADNPNRFTVYEEFVDADAFKAHQQRVADSAWGVAAVNAERHYQISGMD